MTKDEQALVDIESSKRLEYKAILAKEKHKQQMAMIEEYGGSSESTIDSASETFWERAKWKRKFCFGFHRCVETKEIIWPFTNAWRGIARWSGPGEDAIETRWLTESAFIFLTLKGDI